MSTENWYQRRELGKYKYVLVKPMAFDTEIHPDETVNYPPSSALIKLQTTGRLQIEKHYAWNGATAFPDLDTMMRATLAHDALYQLMRSSELHRKWRKGADRLLRKVSIQDGMSRTVAYSIYGSVRALGWYRL